MYCPKCGQEQFSDSIRFCSRCGFQLEGVSRLLANDGALETVETGASKKPSLYRQITSRFGAKIIFFSLFLLPFAFLLAIAVDAPAFLFIPFGIFFLGLMQIIYMQIFSKTLPPEQTQTQPGTLNAADSRLNLPPAPEHAAIPIIDIKGGKTAKINPPSVTEPTTDLLEFKDE